MINRVIFRSSLSLCFFHIFFSHPMFGRTLFLMPQQFCLKYPFRFVSPFNFKGAPTGTFKSFFSARGSFRFNEPLVLFRVMLKCHGRLLLAYPQCQHSRFISNQRDKLQTAYFRKKIHRRFSFLICSGSMPFHLYKFCVFLS